MHDKKNPKPGYARLGLLSVLPQILGFYAERPGVSGDGVASQSWPKRTDH
jgi:hypothetical protein